ncbi:hypothetical protein [Anaerofustis stercorihominis]|uniref:hypothetical protein n=1 Tax=Anaerofustis stercorihominis TaxID=214853 RepID=UPI002671C9AD|nr:hypothetical protein [Anaerofustis stercorihominis]
MELNIYKNQKEIKRTVEADTYDLMYGTVEDVLNIFDEIDDLKNESQILKLIKKNMPTLNNLLLDIFDEANLKREELRCIKVKELVPLFFELIDYIKNSFGDDDAKK